MQSAAAAAGAGCSFTSFTASSRPAGDRSDKSKDSLPRSEARATRRSIWDVATVQSAKSDGGHRSLRRCLHIDSSSADRQPGKPRVNDNDDDYSAMQKTRHDTFSNPRTQVCTGNYFYTAF